MSDPHGSVALAAVIGAHGVAGEVRLKLFTDDLTPYRSFNGGALTLKSIRHGSNGAIARFAEVGNRTAAEALRGTELTVPRSALLPLEDGEFYFADWVGLPVRADGERVGEVAALHDFGAGSLIEVALDGAKARPLVPVAEAELGDDEVTVDGAWLE